jgi:hypothetical protein
MAIRLPGSEAVDLAVDEVIMNLSSSDEVEAVGFTGSVAFGLIDDKSDIDMICIVNRYMSVEERRNLLGKHDYDKNADTVYQEMFEVDGTRIDIQFRDIGWFEQVLKDKEMASDFNEKYVLYLLQNVVPAWDGKGVIGRLTGLETYTEEFARRKIEHSFAFFKQSKKDIESLVRRNDVTFLTRTYSDILEKYVSVIFALNKRYFSDVKWGLEKMGGMANKPTDSLKDLGDFCRTGNGFDCVDVRISLLKKMILDLSGTVDEVVPSASISGYVDSIRSW